MTNNEFYEIFRDYNTRNYCYGTHSPRIALIKKHFLSLFGDVAVQAITGSDIDSVYFRMEENNLAHNTIFGAYAAMSSYFNLAIAYDEIVHNPVQDALTIRPKR